jgi:hypothetical protein
MATKLQASDETSIETNHQASGLSGGNFILHPYDISMYHNQLSQVYSPKQKHQHDSQSHNFLNHVYQ